MNWMYEPRGNYPDYGNDENEGATSSSLMWYQVLYTIPLLILFMLVVQVTPAIYGFYYMAKKTYDDGKLESPRLTIIGFCLGAILIVAQMGKFVDLSNHPFITFCSVIFIIYFTLAPLTGLGVLFLRLTNTALNNLKSIAFIALLSGFILLLVLVTKLLSQP